jgi:two-component system, sensor histidine kinase and response regulator
VSSYSSSLVLKKNISHQVWQHLVELWLSMAANVETQLFTQDTLSTLLENERKITISPPIENFYLLTGLHLNALLLKGKTVNAEIYQVSLVFEREAIINELINLGNQQENKVAVINCLRTEFIGKLTRNSSISQEFMVRAVKLLLDSTPQQNTHQLLHAHVETNQLPKQENEPREPYFSVNPEQYNNLYSTTPMEKLLNYQAEQERIFAQTKLQISQDFTLAEIIQTAIEHSCSFLELDRLLIFQLDIPQESNSADFKSGRRVDKITYEARKNEAVSSTLYFHEEGCWQESPRCINQYQEGFNLIINDLDVSCDLNPCMKSLMANLQVKAKVAIPINVQGKLWGLLIAHQCQPRHWHQKDIQFLGQVAEYVSLAVLNRYSYEQLQQQKQLLEKQVEVQAQQLKDALIAAEAASKSKHDFLGSMSHELRTPLTCVIGLSSTLLQWSSTKKRMPLSPEKQHEYLHLIQQSGRHLLGLINNILEFSDVESGKHLLNIQQVSLNEIVKQSLYLLQESALTKEITLRAEIKVQSAEDYFLADEIRLKEILFHILSNSIKFTPQKGEVVLRVWREQHQVIFQMEDTGIGIATEEIPLLFEKFKQIENYRQRVHGGTGLGLALTKKLVELHGGTIEVESSIGQGSMFTVYLPEKDSLKFNLANNLVKPDPPQAVLNSQTIVLITEDEASATFFCQLLNTIDHQVVWLMDSAMAISQIELLQPRIIIIDQDCSVMDVENVVNAISHASLTNKTNVTLLCDRFEHEEWQKFTKCGVDEYLLKSMEPTQIINKINNLLQAEGKFDKLQDI